MGWGGFSLPSISLPSLPHVDLNFHADVIANGISSAYSDLSKNLGGSGNIFNDALNVGTNWSTFGMVGFDGKKFGAGVVPHAADEGLGEVFGRNMARDVNWQNQVKYDAEVARRNQQTADEQNASYAADRAASFAAGSARNGTAIRGGAQKSLKWQPLGNEDEQDFLGL